ncbi:ATP-binding protein [Stigmatella aurantiaca]|uniref:Adenylate/guanylate cyclase domain protein n=1 Tax=Stigmatella aurantiaca (strain DW4/3-1) TaxID=378806 RepID=Q09DE0_STIAD|nr:adenylate/guanylate cyclase domain-containing protein [Stigmatella aurantiaca]ADO69370.1 Adenylate/guanylate cyclase domain protein [Stigmatella aurantiaca DW4/3-1]EAU69771.1 transcriptional regulator, LuxR family, putative [Stigmatella aurantiaca DW4/3-1]
MGEVFPGEDVSAPCASRVTGKCAAESSGRRSPPSGTVALVFTEIQSATRLWERCVTGMREALEIHDRVLRALLESGTGYEVKVQGGSFMVAFPSPVDAVRWCLEAQEALLEAPWPEELLAQPEAAVEVGLRGWVYRGPRVLMGVHVGEPECRINMRTGRADYYGRMVNTAARVAAAGHGGQVLVSGEAWAQVAPEVRALGQPAIRPLGSFRFRGIENAVALVEALPASLSERRFGAPRAPRVRQGNAPTPQSELIGRSTELKQLRQALADGVRLLTLLGPGGMGKTRLATHLGGLELESCAWTGGVWLCELAEAKTAEALCQAVGQAIGASLTREAEAGGLAEQLGHALDDCGELLLILDNLEQVTSHAAGLLERWLALAPRARFLVTSREALGVPGEHVLDLEPLPLPEPGEHRLEVIARSEAVRLFVQRARESRGGFELTAEEAPRVVDIVRQLDGNALAIELAAARTGVMGVSQLRDRLPRRFELLRGGRRDVSARQATLRGAIDWSWHLLSPAEKSALSQCSVFRGGFTPRAAEAVLVLPPGSPGVGEVLHALRSKSLLRLLEAGDSGEQERLGLYESIRQYAAERLVEEKGDAAVVARHAEWYLTLARAFQAKGHVRAGAEGVRQLSLERENLLAVCDECLARASAEPRGLAWALNILEALEPDVLARGPARPLLTRLERVIALAGSLGLAPASVASAWAVRGRVLLEAGQPEAARKNLEQACAALRGIGEEAAEKRVLVDLSIVARHQGDVAAAWEFIQRAQGLSSGGDRWLEAYAMGHLGLVEQVRVGAEVALPYLWAAQTLFEALGDVTLEVCFTTHGAVALGELGRTAEAVDRVSEAMHRAASVGDQVGHVLARLHLGRILLDVGRASEAREHLTAAVRMAQQLRGRSLEGMASGELGRTELVLGEFAEARNWLAEAVSLLDGVAQGLALRFAAYRAAVDAMLGDAEVARESFTALEAAPEFQQDPVLRGLTALLRAAADLTVARTSSGSGLARQVWESSRRLLEEAQRTPVKGSSSHLRGALSWLERVLSQQPA